MMLITGQRNTNNRAYRQISGSVAALSLKVVCLGQDYAPGVKFCIMLQEKPT